MLLPEHKILISTKHQSYLKILDANINDGETVTWAVIRKSYKERALIVHPDKGGSEDTFKELNTAFLKLEHLVENGTELEFDDLTEMPSSLDEMLNELMAHFDRMDEDLKRSFYEIHSSLDKLDTSVGELNSSVSELHASIQAIDDKFNIDIPFYMGCYAVFLGSIVSAISGKYQPPNARHVGAFVFGAGLIATGGYLITNSLFQKSQATPNNEDNQQSTKLKLVNNTN